MSNVSNAGKKARVAVIYGTRPEAIKMAPLIRAMQAYPEIEVITVSTQQHESLLSATLDSLDIATDLELCEPNRSTVQTLVASIGIELEKPISECDFVVVQGDTISAYAGALAGLLQKKPVIHLEAGLRTSDLHQPHPEEGLRRAITHLASLHLAPTDNSRRNLEREGVSPSSIVVTGNTSIDAIKHQLGRLGADASESVARNEKYCVVTVHRRENWGAGLDNIARAVFQLAQDFPDVEFICPLHPNPIVRKSFLDFPSVGNFRVIDPLRHDDFVQLLAGCQLILTDSGGIQEEATVLGVPVLILREETERPEVVDSGWGFIAGTDEDQIVKFGRSLLNLKLNNEFIDPDGSPFGLGDAGERAAEAINAFVATN